MDAMLKPVPGLMVLLICMCGLRAAEIDGFTSREDVFEFTEKPRLSAEKGKLKIRFAVKGFCDATVAVLDKDSAVIRHLASGVLGRNAPLPFSANSLAQTVEWDGLDDLGRPAPAGCRVRVGLGLKARHADSLLWHPHDLAPVSESDGANVLSATGKDGLIYVAAPLWLGWHGRVYNPDGSYARTFWPPASADLEKNLDLLYGPGSVSNMPLLGKAELRLTRWGDKAFSAPIHGPFESSPYAKSVKRDNIAAVMARASGGAAAAPGPIPEAIVKNCPPSYPQRGGLFEKALGTHHWSHMTVNRRTDELYVCGRDRNYQDRPVCLYRLDGKTGKLDDSWFSQGEFRCMNAFVGPDELIYARVGAFGQWILRLDRDGKAVDFQDNGVLLPRKKYPDTGEVIGFEDGWSKGLEDQNPKVLWTGKRNWGRVQERGLYVSPSGKIVLPVESIGKPDTAGRQLGLPEETKSMDTFMQIWENSGKQVTANAIGNMRSGNGVGMDRDGNIYAALMDLLPEKQFSNAKQCAIFGLGQPVLTQTLGGTGSWLKYKAGAAHPLSVTKALAKGETAPDGAVVMSNGTTQFSIAKPAWVWPGLSSQGGGYCACHHVRPEVDYFARQWIPCNHLNSLVVLDANGNLIARLGRYGNVDDTERDLKAGGDGLRFAWIKSITISDAFLYVADRPNRRILKAALSFHQEDTPPVPADFKAGGK
jgi:hypothetical protein